MCPQYPIGSSCEPSFSARPHAVEPPGPFEACILQHACYEVILHGIQPCSSCDVLWSLNGSRKCPILLFLCYPTLPRLHVCVVLLIPDNSARVVCIRLECVK